MQSSFTIRMPEFRAKQLKTMAKQLEMPKSQVLFVALDELKKLIDRQSYLTQLKKAVNNVRGTGIASAKEFEHTLTDGLNG